jgi:hypothetical protein
MCHHVSGMERLAYKLGMLKVVCHVRLSGDGSCLCDILCELSEPYGANGATVCGKPQHCKRGHFVRESIAKHDILL